MEVLSASACSQLLGYADFAAAAIHQDFPINPHNISGENSHP